MTRAGNKIYVLGRTNNAATFFSYNIDTNNFTILNAPSSNFTIDGYTSTLVDDDADLLFLTNVFGLYTYSIVFGTWSFDLGNSNSYPLAIKDGNSNNGKRIDSIKEQICAFGTAKFSDSNV